MLNKLKELYNQKLWHINIINTIWFVLGIAIVFKGFKAPHHFHEEPERYYIIYGKGKMLLNNDIKIQNAPKIIDIPSNVVHAMTPLSNIVILFYTFPKGYFENIKYNYKSEYLI
mgnify:CR=1 FL=1